MHEGHDENEKEMDHEHGPYCFSHAEHWRDDSVYANPDFDTDNLPTGEFMAETIGEAMDEKEDEKIYRFALVYVNGDGAIQLMSNPGMTPMSSINLLSSAIRILAFQEGALEAAAQNIINRGMGKALKEAMAGDGELPDLSDIMPVKKAGKHAKVKSVKKAKDQMDEGYL